MTELNRTSPPAPVRIVHLGLGNFFRAHQAWYTEHAPDDWGIAAFTGRRPDAATALAPQDGLYTLITRAADGDRFEVITSLSAVHASDDHEALLSYLAAPETAVITSTVTEAGYRTDDADLDALRADPRAAVQSLPAKIVAGLLARRAAEAGPITVLPCDNLPHNGSVARELITTAAERVDPTLVGWIETNVDFASSMVDRITPATTDADRAVVADQQGYVDASPVPTEPFSEWVINGTFPAGRPRWEEAGATLVDDVAPFEQRKLWLLNGAHSLLAYAGSVRGHQTVDQAIADPACRAWVEQFWDEAARHLELSGETVTAYRAALLDRWANPRIAHRLAQIAADGTNKLPVRILPALDGERAAGRTPVGCATVIAAWLLHLRGQGAPVKDVGADRAVPAAAPDDLRQAAAQVLDLLQPGLATDSTLVDAVLAQAAAIPQSALASEA